MNVVDILITIIVVTILVTIILAIVTYVAYKLRLSREPAPREDDPGALRYFVRYDPPSHGGGVGGASSDVGGASSLDRLDQDAATLGGHASQS